MPVTEVQWIGSSCGQHSSYTFYRGFRLIVDGTVKNYCLGEFYFVRNSANQPICIAELQLVWYDSSTDSQLASARLYFRPEDTPAGRLSCHGQDELLYADQKVVIKCRDMAIWQDTGDHWSFGLIPLCESDFECIDRKYYLKCNHVQQETQRRTWLKGEHPRTLHILTFPAYCRYRALMKRLSNGVCFTRTQLIALGGVITEHKNTRVVFCRDSFHHPYLDKFELSGETKAPVLKGRPRKKKRLHGVSSSVLSKKRFVADIQNHLISHLRKKSKWSEEEESAESDRSEDVLEKIKSLPQKVSSDQNNGPPPLIKSRIEIKTVQRSSIDLKNVPGQDVSHTRGERHGIPPPLIPSNQAKGNIPVLAQKKPSHEQNGPGWNHSRTDSGFAQLSSSEKQVTEAQDVISYPTTGSARSTSKSLLVKKIQAKVNMVPVISSYGTPSKNTPMKTSVTSNCQTLQNVAVVTNSQHVESLKLSTMLSARPTSSADGGVCIGLETSQKPEKPDVCAQPATPRQLVSSVQRSGTTTPVGTSLQSNTIPVSVHTVTSSVNMVYGTPIPSSRAEVIKRVTSNCDVTAKTVVNKESNIRQLRLQSASESTTDENEAVNVEPVLWRKKKRLRMPGSIKDEEYEDDDEKYFMQTLRDFMKARNTPLGKIPALGFKKVNLWTMYTTAQRFGGYDAVTSKRMWRRVYDSLGGSTTITSAATYTRRHYERLLLPYERHIRSQLKDKVDKTISTVPSSHAKMAHKEPAVLSAKQGASLPSTIANCGPESSVCLDKKFSSPAKSIQADSQTVQSRNLVSNTTVLARNAMPSKVTRTLDHRRMLVDQQPWEASSDFVTGQAMHTSAIPTDAKVSSRATCATTIAFNPQAQESHGHSGRDSYQVPPVRTSTTVPAVATIAEVASSQDNIVYHCVKLERNDEWTSARTSAVYAKSSVAVTHHGSSSTEPSSLQRVVRKRNSDNLVPQSAQHSGQVCKAKEVIDLTSDDSSPAPKIHSPALVKKSSENFRKKPESSGPPRMRGPDSRQDIGHLQKLDEHHDHVHRCHSVRESQPSVEVTPVQSTKSYNAPHSSRVMLQVRDSSVPQNAYNAKDEAYYNVRKEVACQKQEKTRNLQTQHVENLHGKMTVSPSLERADEHFAQWHCRQSGIQQPHSRHGHATHTTYPGDDHELSQLRYTYVNEDMCDQDCACSVPKKRKENAALAPTPRMKKEHYEDDLPYTGMAVYPGRWTPPVVADHPDLYITSHADYMQGSPGSLGSHMCTTSRVFLPQSQIFTSPYHMGMTPVGAPTLLASSDDRLHLHPHCLIPSPYPCTSNSRAPEAGSYPLYSFT